MAKQTKPQAIPAVAAVVANVGESDRLAAVAATKQAMQAPLKVQDDPWKKAGYETALSLFSAEKKVVLVFIGAGMKCATASNAATTKFIEGYLSGYPTGSEATLKVRKSEMVAVLRAAHAGGKAWSLLCAEVEAMRIGRSAFLDKCREIAPATGQGARTDTPLAAAVAANVNADPVKQAAALADAAKQVEAVKAAKVSRKRAGTAIKAMQESIGAANLSEAMAVADAGIKQVAAVGGNEAAVALLRYIADTAARLQALPGVDAWLGAVAGGIVQTANDAMDRAKGETAKVAPTVAAAAQDLITQRREKAIVKVNKAKAAKGEAPIAVAA
jgi:hypothetical protein